MVKQLFITILFSISTNLALAQTSNLKLIESEKYSKAEKNISKGLLKTPDDIALNYSMGVLFCKRKFEKYNPETAYSYLMKSKSFFDKLNDDKQLKELDKIPINSLTFVGFTDTICRLAMEDAISINSVVVYEKYLTYFKKAPPAYTKKVTENRDVVAFEIAMQENSVESYQHFISSYPEALQINEAVKKRNALAFEKVKLLDNIEAYKGFIEKYKLADEIPEAWSRIHELAFAEAELENTSTAYKKFINEYPKSKQYNNAFELYEHRQFSENTILGDWNSFRLFIKNHPHNSWKSAAQDTIFSIASKTENLAAMKYCVDNFTGYKRNTALLIYHDLYTNDGESETLELFYAKYDDPIFEDIKSRDQLLAIIGDRLYLDKPYTTKYFSDYDNYIRLAAPREKAFVALQRMISPDIAVKDWKNALKKINIYKNFFGEGNKKILNLISILEAKSDNTIKITSVGSGINTTSGGEYVPVISADDKLLYFCAKGRNDNLGGEDIFVSTKSSGSWSSAKLVSGLSSSYENDAPLSITADGNTILLFKGGKLYYSDKTKTGWSEAIEFSETINSGNWQADAMISSDGKALFFVSTKQGGHNLYTGNTAHGGFHGDNLHPADIYVSVRNKNNEWGSPINIGSVINTQYCDRMPFLHPDMKTLYFSSDGHGGLGKLDVFKSTRLSDDCWDCWSEPINMGREINTEESDWGYKISTDGEKAYFSKSNTANEEENIYWLNLPSHLRPELVATVSGTLVDKNNLPVSAEIRWEDLETGENVGQSKSNPEDGSFFIVLPLGKIYGYYVESNEYFPISNSVDLRKNDAPVQIESDIKMVTFDQMIEDGTAVSVNNLFFNFGESELLPHSIPELKRVASIIKLHNLKVQINGHTDNIGDDEKNQILSEKRADAVKVFLVNEGCISENLTIVGYGKTQPIASNDTEIGRAKNRRVELIFIK